MKTIWKCDCKTEHKIEESVKGYTCAFCGHNRDGGTPAPPQAANTAQTVDTLTDAQGTDATTSAPLPPGPPASGDTTQPTENATDEAQEN